MSTQETLATILKRLESQGGTITALNNRIQALEKAQKKPDPEEVKHESRVGKYYRNTNGRIYKCLDDFGMAGFGEIVEAGYFPLAVEYFYFAESKEVKKQRRARITTEWVPVTEKSENAA